MIICLDASIVIKWFKPEEKYSKEAMQLLEVITQFKIDCVANEWISLEIVRGLRKAQLMNKKLKITIEDIEDAYKSIEDLFELLAIQKVSVGRVKNLAKDLELFLNLYPADAVHLATAIETGFVEFFVTADKHLLKEKVKRFALKEGIKIINLKELIREFEKKGIISNIEINDKKL